MIWFAAGLVCGLIMANLGRWAGRTSMLSKHHPLVEQIISSIEADDEWIFTPAVPGSHCSCYNNDSLNLHYGFSDEITKCRGGPLIYRYGQTKGAKISTFIELRQKKTP